MQLGARPSRIEEVESGTVVPRNGPAVTTRRVGPVGAGAAGVGAEAGAERDGAAPAAAAARGASWALRPLRAVIFVP